jgi:serine/threonine protein kinase
VAHIIDSGLWIVFAPAKMVFYMPENFHYEYHVTPTQGQIPTSADLASSSASSSNTQVVVPTGHIEGERGLYAIMNEIGRGGFGTVFRAQRWGGTPQCAVKMVHNSNIEEIEKEVQYLRECQHASKTSPFLPVVMC